MFHPKPKTAVFGRPHSASHENFRISTTNLGEHSPTYNVILGSAAPQEFFGLIFGYGGINPLKFQWSFVDLLGVCGHCESKLGNSNIQQAFFAFGTMFSPEDDLPRMIAPKCRDFQWIVVVHEKSFLNLLGGCNRRVYFHPPKNIDHPPMMYEFQQPNHGFVSGCLVFREREY